MQKGLAAPLIILGVIIIIIVAAGAFYVQSTQHSLRYFFQPAIKKLPPFLQPSVTFYETINWKTYQLKKTYRNGDLKFSINYPSEWQVITEERNVRWYGKNAKGYAFEVSWLSPDVIYDVIGLCAGNSCSKVIEMVVDEGVTMEIWRLNEAARTQRKLPSTFLHATIKNSEKPVLPEFNTMSLPEDDFKAILSTFKFT